MSDTSDPDFSRTLELVLSRVGRGSADLEQRRRIDRALQDHLDRLHRFVAADQLRGFSPQQVEETVADVMEVALSKPDTFEGCSHRDFRAWLFGIARGKCANVRRKRREELPGDDALFEADSGTADAMQRLRDAERDRVYARAASALATQDQEVFWMRHVEAYSQEEVARRLGMRDADEVRTTLQRCRRTLVVEIDRILAELGHTRSLLRPDTEQ